MSIPNKKPNVLILTPYYLPGYKAGGPIRSLANLVTSLKDQFEFTIITLDHDMDDTVPYLSLPNSNITTISGACVRYLRYYELNFKTLRAILNNTDHDILYLNSLFCINFTIKPLLLSKLGLITKKPIILAPRGELSPGGLKIKTLKKRIYLAASRLSWFYKKLSWQASNEIEAQQIKRHFGNRVAIKIAPNIFLKDQKPPKTKTKTPNVLKLIYISRITPKKNILFALKLLMHVKGKVIFDIYGPIEDKYYWKKCQKIIERLPENIVVTYKGPVEQYQVTDVLSQYDLFILPTLGENFGHVILESLNAGTPVLISNQTPWPKSIPGCTLPLNKHAIWIQVLEEFCQYNQNSLNALRQKAMQTAQQHKQSYQIIEKHKELLSVN